jgi:hypothetical protein
MARGSDEVAKKSEILEEGSLFYKSRSLLLCDIWCHGQRSYT